MTNLIFGSSGSLGTSIIKIISTKYKNKKFIYISRTRPENVKKNWIKLNLNNNLNNFKYRKVKLCIFLASPKYIKKNMNINIFNNEYNWIKKLTKNLKIENLVYLSSPTIYLKKHYVGVIKIKIEKFLKLNKKKFKSLQVWRPFNLININHKQYTDHFHSLLFKIMFVQKKKSYIFKGNKKDTRGYANINEFSKVLLKNAFLNKSFVKDFGNPDKITIDEIIKIYNRYLYSNFKKKFTAYYMSKKINSNIIKKNSKNSVYSKEPSKKVIKKYLLAKLNEKNT